MPDTCSISRPYLHPLNACSSEAPSPFPNKLCSPGRFNHLNGTELSALPYTRPSPLSSPGTGTNTSLPPPLTYTILSPSLPQHFLSPLETVTGPLETSERPLKTSIDAPLGPIPSPIPIALGGVCPVCNVWPRDPHLISHELRLAKAPPTSHELA